MIIFREDKYKTTPSANHSQQSATRPLGVKKIKAKSKQRINKKTLTKQNSEFLKSLGFTLKKKNNNKK